MDSQPRPQALQAHAQGHVMTFDPANFRLRVRSKVTQLLWRGEPGDSAGTRGLIVYRSMVLMYWS